MQTLAIANAASQADSPQDLKGESHGQAATVEHIEGEAEPHIHLKTILILAVSLLRLPSVPLTANKYPRQSRSSHLPNRSSSLLQAQ